MKFETKCLHAGYSPKNGEPRVQPIVQSTTYTYDSAEEIGKLFDLQAAGYFYTRLANPTTNAAEEKITALEGGVATMCTASGQSAVFYAMLNILEAGDHSFPLLMCMAVLTIYLPIHSKKWVSK